MAIFSTFTGRAGADAELRQAGETPVLSVRVATDRYNFKEKKNEADWINVSLFGKAAEAKAAHVTKGSIITVSGILYAREYPKKDGSTGFGLELRANDLELVGGKQKGEKSPAAEAADTKPTDADSSF